MYMKVLNQRRGKTKDHRFKKFRFIANSAPINVYFFTILIHRYNFKVEGK